MPVSRILAVMSLRVPIQCGFGKRKLKPGYKHAEGVMGVIAGPFEGEFCGHSSGEMIFVDSGEGGSVMVVG